MPKIDFIPKSARLLFSLFLLTSISLFGGDPQYHSITIQKGEGILSILSKYELISYQCNKELFCNLNKIQPDDYLHMDKSYVLPIKIFDYDGKSIRTSIGITDYNKAVRIKQYNEKILAKGLRNTHYTESKILWVPNHELECTPSESVPRQAVKQLESPGDQVVSKKVSNTKPNVFINKIFGKAYEEVNVLDNSLNNQVYYIVSGHGGPDPGAMCKECPQNMCEDEYAYDVSLRLARNLMQHGAIVHMIVEDKDDGIRDEQHLKCDKDEVIYTGAKLPLRQLDRLKQRADAVNKLFYKYKKQKVKSQKLIMVHVDSRGKDKRQDVFFYHYGNSKSSKQLAYNMKDVFEEKYNYYQKGRGYKGYVDNRGLYMLRKTLPTSVYVELANIRNKADHKRLVLDTNRQALANWLFEGLTK